jgi:hypothetical protein
MTSNESELVFETITEADIPELTQVMMRAFDDDARKHLGLERGGPPGYDNGDFSASGCSGTTRPMATRCCVRAISSGHALSGFCPMGTMSSARSSSTRMPRIRVSARGCGSSSRRATPRPGAGAWPLRGGRRRITTSMPQSVGLRAWSPTRSWDRPRVSSYIAKRWPYLQEVWLRV